MSRTATWIRSAAIGALLSIASVSAQAGWVVITDPDPSDLATNPDSKHAPGGTPTSQSGEAIGIWLMDLLNLASAPALLAEADFAGSTISGIPAGALYLTLHYGNLAGYPYNSPVVAYQCNGGDCSSFTGYITQGLSNYRVFGTATSVPEPTTLALMSLGLLGVALAARRRKHS